MGKRRRKKTALKNPMLERMRISRPQSLGEALFNLGVSLLDLEVQRRYTQRARERLLLTAKPTVVEGDTEYWSPEDLKKLKDKLDG